MNNCSEPTLFGVSPSLKSKIANFAPLATPSKSEIDCNSEYEEREKQSAPQLGKALPAIEVAVWVPCPSGLS